MPLFPDGVRILRLPLLPFRRLTGPSVPLCNVCLTSRLLGPTRTRPERTCSVMFYFCLFETGSCLVRHPLRSAVVCVGSQTRAPRSLHPWLRGSVPVVAGIFAWYTAWWSWLGAQSNPLGTLWRLSWSLRLMDHSSLGYWCHPEPAPVGTQLGAFACVVKKQEGGEACLRGQIR